MKFLLFELRQHFTSFWSFLFYVPFIAISIVLIVLSGGSAGVFMRSTFFLDIFLSAYIPVFSIFVVQNMHELEFSMVGRQKLLLIKWLSVALFLLPAMLLLLLYVFLPVHAGTSFALQMDYVKYILLTFGNKILFFSALGFFLGNLTQKKFVYFVGFAAAVITSAFFQNYIFSNVILLDRNNSIVTLFNLLNISMDEPFKVPTYAWGFASETVFFLDKLFYFILTVLLLSLLFLGKRLLSKRNLIAYGVSTLCIGLLVGTYNASVAAYPEEYYGESNGLVPEKYDNTQIQSQFEGLRVVSYDMDVQLRKDFQNICSITVKNGSGKPIEGGLEWKLDDCFQVQRVIIDDQEVIFEQKGDRLILTDTGDVPQDFTVTVEYTGNVNYRNGVFLRSMFVNDKAACLMERFAWYPKLEAPKDEIEYRVQIDSDNPIVSNLADNQATSQEEPYVKTLSSDLYLISGYFETAIVEDKMVTAFPEFIETNRKDIVEICRSIDRGEWNDIHDTPFVYFTNEGQIDPSTLADAQKLPEKTIFFCPFSYDSAFETYCFDDVIFTFEGLIAG